MGGMATNGQHGPLLRSRLHCFIRGLRAPALTDSVLGYYRTMLRAEQQGGTVSCAP